MSVSEESIFEALRVVQDPDLGRDIVSLGFVKEIKICEGDVKFQVELTTPACPVKDILHAEAMAAVMAVPGVTSANIEMTARVRERKNKEDTLPGVRQIIAIASGKGGVGKSTTTTNLAVALAKSGARVGILDADIYGPSIPLMLGCAALRPAVHAGKILPIEKFGLKLMSIGFIVEDDQAMIWRGPMVSGTLRQLINDVEWGELDYLLVDLPPGTGDAPLTLAQDVPLTGVVIVTTPHHVAASIAGKSALLFKNFNAPLLGVIENMSSFICPDCGSEHRIFDGLTGAELAQQLHVPFLGSVPIDPQVSLAADQGAPPILAFPERPQAKAFTEIAQKLAANASILAHRGENNATTQVFTATPR